MPDMGKSPDAIQPGDFSISSAIGSSGTAGFYPGVIRGFRPQVSARRMSHVPRERGDGSSRSSFHPNAYRIVAIVRPTFLSLVYAHFSTVANVA